MFVELNELHVDRVVRSIRVYIVLPYSCTSCTELKLIPPLLGSNFRFPLLTNIASAEPTSDYYRAIGSRQRNASPGHHS
jgi:hypothetical protein